MRARARARGWCVHEKVMAGCCCGGVLGGEKKRTFVIGVGLLTFRACPYACFEEEKWMFFLYIHSSTPLFCFPLRRDTCDGYFSAGRVFPAV